MRQVLFLTMLCALSAGPAPAAEFKVGLLPLTWAEPNTGSDSSSARTWSSTTSIAASPASLSGSSSSSASRSMHRMPPNGLSSKFGVGVMIGGAPFFLGMTIQESLELGALKGDLLRGRAPDLRIAYDMFPRLSERRLQDSGSLSGGEQQMLVTGRSLLSRPQLLLLDEPVLQLAPLIIKQIFETIRRNHEDGITIPLVEQNVNVVLQVATRAYVLQGGPVAIEGTSAALRSDPTVQRAHLGQAAEVKVAQLRC